MRFCLLASARVLLAAVFALNATASTSFADGPDGVEDYGYGRPLPGRAPVDLREAGRSGAPKVISRALSRRAEARSDADAALVPVAATTGALAGGGRPDWLEQERVGPPYEAEGVWYAPTAQPGYAETGMASWYGQELAGRRTASGEVFDPAALTGAHPTLPLPSLVQVTNLETGAEVIVRINDRGPFTGGRIIDLSQRAAQVLGFERAGEARVHVRYLGPAPRKVGRNGAPVAEAPALGTQASLPQGPPPTSPARPPQRGLFVQVGAFGVRANAERSAAAVRAIGGTQIVGFERDGRTLHVVRLGPFQDRARAESAKAAAAQAGFPGAVVLSATR
jgi:rare lipoprotein A